jgi:hypothetical protein
LMDVIRRSESRVADLDLSNMLALFQSIWEMISIRRPNILVDIDNQKPLGLRNQW